MKNNNKKINILLAALIGVIAMPLGSSAQAAEEIGVVGANSATLTATGVDGVARTLKQGDAIYLNDNLTTDTSGRAQIIFKDRSTVSINENAQIRVDNFVYNPSDNKGKLSFNSVKGVFRFIGGALSKKNPVEVHTPVATIGIRGGVVDAHIEAGSGETNAVFVYGKEMTLANASGETVTTTSIGSGFSLDKANGTPTQMTPAQVANSVSSFKKTEGGATVGVKKIPTRDDVKVKAQAIKTEDKQPESKSEQGGSGQNGTSGSGESSESSSQDGGESSTASEDGATTNDTGATTTTDNTTATDNGDAVAPAGEVAGASTDVSPTTPAPDAPKVAISDFQALSPTGAVAVDVKSVAQVVSAASNDAITSKAVEVINDKKIEEPLPPKLPPVVDSSDSTKDKGDDRVLVDAPKSIKDSSAASDSASGAGSVHVPVIQEVSSGGYFSGEDTEGNRLAAAGTVKLATYDGVHALVFADKRLSIPNFEPDSEGAFSVNAVNTQGEDFTVDGYHSAGKSMSVFHAVNNVTHEQISGVVGNMLAANISSSDFGRLMDATEGAFYTALPSINHYQTSSEYHAQLQEALEQPKGVYIDWSKRLFLNVSMDWLNDGGESNNTSQVIVGRITPESAVKFAGRVIDVDGANDTDHKVESGTITSQSIYANDTSIEGVLATASISNSTDTANVHEVPLVRNTNVSSSDLPWLNGEEATNKNWKGYAAGIVNKNVDSESPIGATVYTSGDSVDNVTLTADAANNKAGMRVVTRDKFGSLNTNTESFGTAASAETSAYVNNQTFAATGRSGTSFVVSGNLTGVESDETYEYTQWGVWGGNATQGSFKDVAELVPYVVGDVTQNAGQLSGKASYSGDAYASVANVNGIKNYHGNMKAEANFANRAVEDLEIDLSNVEAADGQAHNLKITQDKMTIASSGNAILTSYGSPIAEYNGKEYKTNVSVNGALFGANAQEIGGSFAFQNVGGLKGAGVYQGKDTRNEVVRSTVTNADVANATKITTTATQTTGIVVAP